MKATYILTGLCCANCAAKIEKAVQGLPGVEGARLNFILEKLVVEQAAPPQPELATELATELDHKIRETVRRYEPRVSVRKVG